MKINFQTGTGNDLTAERELTLKYQAARRELVKMTIARKELTLIRATIRELDLKSNCRQTGAGLTTRC